ncbi:MAG: GntR family transcriptional regulator [Rhodobacteraceae bacterium]|nr:GntR family transcriptional regulator [Paracoccaceae bacterium]
MAKRKSSVDRAYARLRDMAVNFEFKPDERLNESALSVKLGASRTPLREALNRLVAEGLLTFVNGRGFFCRSLNPTRIQELYEARSAIETEALTRTIQRATEADIAAFLAYLDEIEPTYHGCPDVPKLLQMDEEFHTHLAELSGNSELVRMLENINVRIRYVRLINLKMLHEAKKTMPGRDVKLSAHRVIVEAVRARDTKAAVAALRQHIERRQSETTDAVRIAYSQLYVPSYD